MRHALLLILLSACQTAEYELVSQPVIGATIDTEDPAVVALVFSNNSVFCTGTLISPHVILTAAHCIDDASGDPNIAAFFTNDTKADGGRKVGVTLTQQHPMWTGDLSGGHDVGLLLLAAAQDPELAIPVNREDLTTYVGADYRVVGFGIWDMGGGELDGKKRTGVMSIARLTGDYLEAEDPETIICQGDSGGPGFITNGDGVEVLAGTHSYSISGCSNPSGDARPDLWWDSFIGPWIEDHDTACGLDGLCARVGCEDDPDCQPCGADGTCTTDCALPDVDCATQGIGEICQADTQCESGLCVFWQDDPHSKFCSESCGDDADCPDGMLCQNISPFGRVCYYLDEPPGALGQTCEAATDCSEYVCAEDRCTYTCDLGEGQLCPEGFECDSHDDGANYYCWALPTDGGCSTGRGGGGGGLIVALALLAIVPASRRKSSR